jgi:hypothetical protein
MQPQLDDALLLLRESRPHLRWLRWLHVRASAYH